MPTSPLTRYLATLQHHMADRPLGKATAHGEASMVGSDRRVIRAGGMLGAVIW